MRSALLIPLLAGLVAAADGGVPKCAQPCVAKYTTGNEIAGCKQLDIKCVCANDGFLDGIACCLEDACDQAGKDAAVKYAQGICSSEGVTVPDEVVCKSASSSGSSKTTSATATETDSAAAESETPDAAAGLSAGTGAMGAILVALMAL